MNDHECQFAIVHQPDTHGKPHMLGSALDSNEATMTFHQELWRLRKQGRAGEVLLLRCDEGRTLVLRQPLIQKPARRPRWDRASA